MADAESHILIVDDDERIRDLLRKFLVRHGYFVSVARDAEHARRILSGLEFDLLIIDVMMPGENGTELTRSLRQSMDTPIILLTAQGEVENRVKGLEAGADDYMAKPFEPKELLLRINAVLRRVPRADDSLGQPRQMLLGSIRYDVERGELWQGNEPIRLTATEVRLMRILTTEANSPVSREDLAEGIGHETDSAQQRAVDVQITRLRKKIEANPRQPRYLQTVRGEGYMLVPD